jgi:hypothetical protein
MVPRLWCDWVLLLVLFASSYFASTGHLLAQPPAEKQPDGPHFFVPLEQLQNLIQQDKKWVLLTQDEFKKLQDAIKANGGKPQTPEAIGVGNVKYAAKVEEDQLVLQATMQITKFGSGWQALPLEFTDLSVEKATLDNEPARLGRDPQAGGRLTLILDKPGKRTLTLELSRPLMAVGSDKLATFGLPRHSGVELTLDLGAQKHLQWNGLPVERPAANDQPAQYQLALGGQKQVELKITDRPTLQTSEGLVFAHSAIGVRAAPEEVTWQAVCSLQVFGKPVDQLQFRVPETLQIVSITSPGLESWEFGPKGPENGETILNLRYRQPFQEPRGVTIQAVMAAKTSEGWLVPSLKLASVASHTSEIMVTTAPGMRLQLEEAVGVQRMAAADPNATPAVGGLRFTAWREDFLLRFTTQPKAREISAAIVTLLDINSSGLNLKSNITVETRFAPLFEVSMTLPAEWTVTDVLVNQARVAWEAVPQEAGIHQLRIPFASPLAVDQQTVIQLQAHRDPEGWPLEEGASMISLPEIRLVQSNVVEGTIMIAAEPDLDVEPEQLKGLSPAVLDKAVAAQLAYEYQDTHYSGQIQVTRKPSRIAARTLAFHRLDKETLLSHLEARLDIQGGGTRRLTLSLPESAGTSLRFEVSESASRIVEQTAAEPMNGRRQWTLLLDQRARGPLLTLVDVSQPRQKGTEFLPPTLQVVGAERETGMIAFEAEPDQQLNLVVQDATETPLPDVDPADLPPTTAYTPKDRIVAAYGYVLPGYQLKLTERRFDRIAVPTAICDKLEITSILGETGVFQHAATFHLRAVGVQSLQVTLPEDAQLWATLLDNAPIEVRHTSTAYLIPLASGPANNQPVDDLAQRTRTLKLFYRTDAGTLKAAGRLHQTPPVITVLNGDGTEQPLEILEQDWAVHHPWQTEFVSSPGNFQTKGDHHPSSFLANMLSHFEVDAPDKLAWKLGALLLVVLVIAIVRLVIVRTGVRGLVGAVCLLGLACVVLTLPSVESARSVSVKFETKKTSVTTSIKPDMSGGTQEAMTRMATSERRTFGEFLPAFKEPESPAKARAGEQEFATLVTEFNQLMQQRRFHEAKIIADKAKAIDPANATAEIMNWKAKFGFRVDADNKLSDAKDEGFWAALDSPDRAAIPFDERLPEGKESPAKKDGKPSDGQMDPRSGVEYKQMAVDDREKGAESKSENGRPIVQDEVAQIEMKARQKRAELRNLVEHLGAADPTTLNLRKKAADELPAPEAPPMAAPPNAEPAQDVPVDQLATQVDQRVLQAAAPPQQPAVNAPPGLAPTGAVIPSKAVLSLALNLEPPANSRLTNYFYRGRTSSKPAELVVTYQNRSRLSFVTLLLQVLIVVAFWCVRNRPLTLRLLLVSLGIAVPLAAMTVVPANWLPFLDGVFGGTLWGCLLLLTYEAAMWFGRTFTSGAQFWHSFSEFMTRNFSLFLTVGIVGLAAVPAQELKAQEQASKPNEAAVAVPNAPAPMPTDTAPPDTLLVPVSPDLDPEKSDRVFLPHDKFLELWKQGHPDDSPLTESPIPGLIAESLFAAELSPAVAGAKPFIKVTGRFVCYSFREGQVSLPLPLGKVAMRSAKLDGETAPLVNGTDAQPLSILLSKLGVHIVDLEFSVPVELTGPAGKFTLHLGAISAGLLRLTAPAADLNYRVNGSSGAFRRTKIGDQQVVLVPISNGGEIAVSWRPQQSRGDVDAIVHVDSVTALLLVDDGTRLISDWSFQVRQGSLAEIVFALPQSLGVRSIEGQDVGGWEVGGDGENRQLKIFLRRKVENATQIKFDLFVKQKSDDIETLYTIPQFAPKNTTRETGTFAVLADKQFAVRVTKINGLSQIEPQQVPLQRLGDGLPAANVLSYRFATRPFELEIAVNRRQPQLKVQVRHHAHIDPRRIQQLSRFKFNMLGAPRSGLSILLPQGYLLQDVQAPEVSDWHVSGREDSAQMDAEAQLFLEFPAPRTGVVDVVLVGKTLRQPENLKAEISLPYPLETDDLDTQLLMTMDPIYSGRIGVLDNWKSIDPSRLAQQLLGRDVTSGQFGFSTAAPAPAPVPVELTQEVPKLSANVMTLLTVGEESLDYVFAMQWKIDTAGSNTFVFTTPDALAGKLDFPEGNGPRRRGIVHEAIGNNRTRWTVTLEDPQRERFFLIAHTVLPPASNEQVVAPNILFEQQLPGQDPPLIERLETQSQYVVLVNQSQTQLTSAVPDSVETIAADDLLQIIKLREDLVQQAAEIVRIKNPQLPVAWKQQRFKAEQLLPASVNLAHHITVIASDGSWREQASYRLRNRSRQFLALRLPADSEVLSLFVKGNPARPVRSSKDAGVTLIPLPKTTEGDVSFEVQLVLAGHLESGSLPRDWAVIRRKIEVPVPVVVSPEESPEYGIPVAQSTWTVYAPQDMDVEIIKQPDVTNVNTVTETLQTYDQTMSMLSDVSELISVNSSTYNRRAKAQSLNNLKQLNFALSKSVADNPAARDSNEQAKQQDLQRRVSQLQQSIDKLVVSNTASGLTVTNDSYGNSVVFDEKAGQEGQAVRVNELYFDNGGNQAVPVVDPNASDFSAIDTMSKPAAAQTGKKGNLNREALRDKNLSQVQALNEEQIKSSGGQRSVGNSANAPFAPGPQGDLVRRGDYPKVGTIVGMEQPNPMSNGLPTSALNDASKRAYVFQSPANPGQQDNDSLRRVLIAKGLQPEADDRAPAKVGGAMGGNLGPMNGGGGQGGGLGAMGMPGMRPVGGPGAQQAANSAVVVVPPPVWSSAGGLSLLIEIPTNGQKLSFSKVGGEPKLMLGVRPHQTLQLALGFVWALVWSIILLLVLITLRRPQATAILVRQLPWFLAGLGMMLYCLVPSNVHWEHSWGTVGLLAFIIGSVWVACQRPLTTRSV